MLYMSWTPTVETIYFGRIVLCNSNEFVTAFGYERTFNLVEGDLIHDFMF